MTGKLIFKMELFKFLRDKSFLITAGIIGAVNIVLTLIFLSVSSSFTDYYYESGAAASLIATVGVIGVIVFFGNIVFAFIYPFHMISMDYKNNVMAMMVASGVNRQKLFFAKIGAIFICTLALTLMITLIPMILLLVKLIQVNAFDQLGELFSSFFYYTELSFGKIFFSSLLGYLNSLMIIATACISMKGKNISFLLFIGLNIVNSTVSGILNLIPFAFSFNMNGLFMFQMFVSVISIAVFGLISLKILERQNL